MSTGMPDIHHLMEELFDGPLSDIEDAAIAPTGPNSCLPPPFDKVEWQHPPFKQTKSETKCTPL
jgi:hypothetical protein